MTEHSKEDLEKEFSPFLNPAARGDVKNIAIDYVLGMTGKEDGKQMIASSQKFLDGVISLCEDSDEGVHNKAFKALTNIATDSKLSLQIVKNNKFSEFIVNCFKKFLDPSFRQADSVCKFVSNLSRPEECAGCIATIILQSKDVSLSKIVNAMCNVEYNLKSNLHFLAPLLGNLSQVPQVRTELMTEREYVIQRCLPFLTYQESAIRRGGIASLIKNCLFDTGYHDWLLGDKVDLLPRLLLPLAGGEEFDDDDMERLPADLQYLPPDKQRESDPDIRKIIVECLFQLCATKKGRQFVKEKNTYVIMREYHQWEPERMNNPAIMNLIDVLIGDEPAPEHENLREVEVPEDLKKKFTEDDEEEILQIKNEINSQ
ncbi:protein HGH1 homolog [Mytilus edulis]|uniref:protein HGH1 homolog n=1 Tax=Mytilus edulis TaxID=6550 RepID=UPI0039EDF030